VTCFLLPGSIVISAIVSRIGRFRWAIWTGWIISCVGCGLFELFDEGTPTPVWAVILAVFGVGQGMLLTSINVGIQAISRVEDAGRAAAMYAFMRTLGMSIGVTIGGTAFQNVMASKLRELGLPEDIANNSEAYVKIMRAMDPTDPVRISVMQACRSLPFPAANKCTRTNPSADVKGFHGVYWIVTASACAAFICSLFIKRHSMDKLLATKFILRGGRNPHHHSIVLDPPLEQEPKSTTTSSRADSSQATTMVPTPRQPGLFKSSDVGCSRGCNGRAESDSESTTKAQEASETAREKQDSTLSSLSNERAVIEVAAVAYYVEPGGKVTPVDILNNPMEETKNGGQAQSEMQHVSASQEEGPTQANLNRPEILISAPLDGEGVADREVESLPEPLKEDTASRRQSVSSQSEEGDDHFEDSSPEPPYKWTDPESLQGVETPPNAVSGVEGGDPVPRPGSAQDRSSYATLEPASDPRLSRKSWS